MGFLLAVPPGSGVLSRYKKDQAEY